MRIAYISFEHPDGIAGGGIGTYIGQIARLMASRGHEVEVFAATYSAAEVRELDGYTLHLIPAITNSQFAQSILQPFTTRHASQRFDIVEAAEFGADALLLKRLMPDLPLALKLHTPTFLIAELNGYKRGFLDKLRFIAGGLLRLQRIKFYWRYNKSVDPEFELFQKADIVSSPSESLAKIVAKKWGQRVISIIPYSYNPAQALLELPVSLRTGKLVVAFIGKLEKRKGIFDLLKAIPSVLACNHNIEFHFIGATHKRAKGGSEVEDYIEKKLARYTSHIKLLGFQSPGALPALLEAIDICVFPSIWENFPFVCLESMAAGKAVIGSASGGMAEMITHLENGYLIQPKCPFQIKEAVLELANNVRLRRKLGRNATKSVLERYNDSIIGSQIEAFYNK